MAAFDLLKSLWAKLTGQSSSRRSATEEAGRSEPLESAQKTAKPGSASEHKTAKPAPSDAPASASAMTAQPAPAVVSGKQASEAAAKPPPAAEAGSFDSFAADLKDSIDFEMDIAIDPPADPAAADAAQAVDEDGGPQELFASIAANYAQPIKDFVFELKRGTATSDWVEICMPVLGSLIHGAESLDLDTVGQHMVGFRDALAEAESSNGREFSPDTRQRLLERFEAMAATMPTTFGGEADDNRRETILVHALLRQIPEVGHVTLEKLYSAGLTSLQVLFMAHAEDMSYTTGVPIELCERICRKIQSHRERIDGSKPEEAKRELEARLVELVHELRGHHRTQQQFVDDSYVSSEAGKQKRECLRLRQACILKIDVLLAEMDEVELVEELRTMAVGRRLDRLVKYLGPAAAQSAAAEGDPGTATSD